MVRDIQSRWHAMLESKIRPSRLFVWGPPESAKACFAFVRKLIRDRLPDWTCEYEDCAFDRE